MLLVFLGSSGPYHKFGQNTQCIVLRGRRRKEGYWAFYVAFFSPSFEPRNLRQFGRMTAFQLLLSFLFSISLVTPPSQPAPAPTWPSWPRPMTCRSVGQVDARSSLETLDGIHNNRQSGTSFSSFLLKARERLRL